jgi:SOS-response transcriptional repressor LexA
MIEWNNLQKLLSDRGKKAELSEKTGISTGNISDWFNPNKPAQPSADALYKIAEHFGCSVDYLMGLTNIEKIETEPKIIYRFPIFYQSAAAGIGKLSETNYYQMKELKLKSVPKKAVFGIYIEGHSMETIIYENDIVLIDPSIKEPSNLDDEIVVARFGEELICKRLSVNEDNQTYDFISENPDDKDKGRYNQKQSNFTLVGKVVKIIHAYETGFGIFSYSEE